MSIHRRIDLERIKDVLTNEKINRAKLALLVGRNRVWISDFAAGKRNPSDEELILLKTEINKIKIATKNAIKDLGRRNTDALLRYFRVNPVNVLGLVNGNRQIQSAIISAKNGKTKGFPFQFDVEIKQAFLVFALELNI
jgi:hypothetical protein